MILVLVLINKIGGGGELQLWIVGCLLNSLDSQPTFSELLHLLFLFGIDK